MSNLLKRLVPEEFVIDERPEPVCTGALESPVYVSHVKTDEPPPAGIQTDLVTQVGEMLYQHAQLENEIKLLQSRGHDDQLEKFVRQFLPFLDNFWRMLEMGRENDTTPEVDNWLKNFESLYDRIVRLFETHGLVFINSVGKEVNLDCHEVVEYRPTKSAPHNHVIRELERGVVFKNRLIRDAKVVVAYNP